jgi:hypothetical protein
VAGFSAAAGWDAASGLGSPQVPNTVDLLQRFVSPLDGLSEIIQSFLKTNKHGHGHMSAH